MAEHLVTGTLPLVLASAVAAISLGLLAAAGVVKLIDPEPTTGAMRTAGLPASKTITRGLGLVEISAGVVGLTIGGATATIAAFLYGAFAVFTFAATRMRIPVQSCGCFGRDDTPPGYLHVTYNLVATVGLIVVALSGLTPIEWANGPLVVTLTLVFTTIGVFASYLLLARLPLVIELATKT